MVQTEEEREVLRAQRKHLGLDPDAAPAFEDVAHVWALIQDMRAGKRPDIAPPNYRGENEDTTPSGSVEPPSEILEQLKLSKKQEQMPTYQLPESLEELKLPLTEDIEAMGKALAVQRENDMRTKAGREKWEKLEQGPLGPPGYYKAWKEVEYERRLQQKPDFKELLRVAEEQQKKAEEEAAMKKPATGTGKGKGKKK